MTKYVHRVKHKVPTRLSMYPCSFHVFGSEYLNNPLVYASGSQAHKQKALQIKAYTSPPLIYLHNVPTICVTHVNAFFVFYFQKPHTYMTETRMGGLR